MLKIKAKIETEFNNYLANIRRLETEIKVKQQEITNCYEFLNFLENLCTEIEDKIQKVEEVSNENI